MKPKVAFFDFTGCEGCQLQVISLGDDLLGLLQVVEVVNFREAMSDRGQDYDIAIIDGAISQPADIERIQAIRKQAKTLVAIGACACLGGVNSQKNFRSPEDVRRYVYGDRADLIPTIPARPVSQVVPVDWEVRGCPITRSEFVKVISALLRGLRPIIPNYPVCKECRAHENVCMYDKGMVCLGPVTRAGCDPMCPSFGNFCFGCRGLIDNPNLEAEKEILKERGLSLEEIIRFFRFTWGSLDIAGDMYQYDFID